MRYSRLILGIAGVIAVLSGPALEAQATSVKGDSGLPASCEVKNPSGGAIAIRGTIALESALSTGAKDVDITMRLVRGSEQHFFHFRNLMNIEASDKKEILCQILAVDSFVNGADGILAAFGFQGRVIKITNDSISNFEPDDSDVTIYNADGTATAVGSTMADITLYIQK